MSQSLPIIIIATLIVVVVALPNLIVTTGKKAKVKRARKHAGRNSTKAVIVRNYYITNWALC